MVSVISRIGRTVSWSDIVEYDSLASGDVITITLKNDERVDLEVAHDERGEQFFVFRDCLKTRHNMNGTNTNRGGWRDCKMRQYAQEVFELLPDDLRAVIIPTTIVQCINNERIECEDKLFCLSYTQVFGEHNDYKKQEPEDTQLDIYKLRRNRVKGYGVGNNDYCSWWLRSPTVANTTYFCSVVSGGNYYYYYASISRGVCFGFRIQSRNQEPEEKVAT